MRFRGSRRGIASACALAASLLGPRFAAAQQPTPPPVPPPAASQLPTGPGAAAGSQDFAEYPIGPKDLLEIRVLEIPELNVDRRVSDAGNIALPLLGDLAVGGLTPGQARLKLETLLKQKYVN